MIEIENLDKLDKNSPQFKDWNNKILNLGMKLETYLDGKRLSWNNDIIPLTMSINDEPSKLPYVQAKCLEYRHTLTDEISTFMIKLSKEISKMRKTTADRHLFYAAGFGIKTNASEKKLLIEAELSELLRNKELLEIHLEFLKEARQTCDNINWAVKNKIELYNITQ